ncbi:MAG: hypothetical protein R3D88_05755 [Alphaproteobacteria bacterium]|jgi:hypothetical protein|nr:hypothetical protein [Alphaproteobacteria bacterium]
MVQVNIQELVRETGLDEKIYPGKKLVKKYVQPGEFKSHCMVFDWRSDVLRIELKAGLTGHNLELRDLKNYPVSYQAPTYMELVSDDVLKSKTEDDEEDEDEGKGKSGGGGKKPAIKKLEDSDLSLSAFDKVTEGIVPDMAEIKKFVVMGKELAQEAFAQAFENLKEQLHQTKVMAMDIMKNVGDVIKKATPGGGLEAKGDESIKYKYDAEKTAALFGGMSP